MRFINKGKLSPRFIRPFKILSRVREVVYKFALTLSLSTVHLVFHVFMLYKYMTDESHVLLFDSVVLGPYLSSKKEPVNILYRQVQKLRTKEITSVSWTDGSFWSVVVRRLGIGIWGSRPRPGPRIMVPPTVRGSYRWSTLADLSWGSGMGLQDHSGRPSFGVWELEYGGLDHGLDHGSWSHLRSVGPAVGQLLVDFSWGSGMGLVDPQLTTIILKLVDNLVSRPEGIMEYVLVQVESLIFPVDFVLFNFKSDPEVSFILGCHFFSTMRILTDVVVEQLTIRAHDKVQVFDVYRAMKMLVIYEDLSVITVIDLVVKEHYIASIYPLERV
ncbi:hypothetical protein MTR67_031696 [Solanum verrucosum]|uniref:Tf2-1-like SH3-like domain-containing protein n=1 Tax=Solanum verrucosum TaxID=315347 RepID=A0AAF0ZE80_SOLVR|nr:hypothetical protein MTR67_031696 [Solanum verrucosum]